MKRMQEFELRIKKEKAELEALLNNPNVTILNKWPTDGGFVMVEWDEKPVVVSDGKS